MCLVALSQIDSCLLHSFDEALAFVELFLHTIDGVLDGVKVNGFVILVYDALQFLIEIVVELVDFGSLLTDESLSLVSHVLELIFGLLQ